MKRSSVLLAILLLASCAPRSSIINTTTLIIAPETVACPEDSLRQCYQIKDTPSEGWRIYEGELVGLAFEEGVTYEVMVQERLRAGSASPFSKSFLLSVQSGKLL